MEKKIAFVDTAGAIAATGTEYHSLNVVLVAFYTLSVKVFESRTCRSRESLNLPSNRFKITYEELWTNHSI
jgi:hypothetical protein